MVDVFVELHSQLLQNARRHFKAQLLHLFYVGFGFVCLAGLCVEKQQVVVVRDTGIETLFKVIKA